MAQERGVRGNSVFAAVSNPDRRKILDILRSGGLPAGEIVSALSWLPQPAVSRHLKVLREAGLVVVSPKAQMRVYSLQPLKLRELDSWLSTYREFWTGRMDALEAHLSKESESRRQEN